MCVKSSWVAPWLTNAQLPSAAQNLLMPYPGTDKESKCPAVAQGVGGWGVLGTAGID